MTQLAVRKLYILFLDSIIYLAKVKIPSYKSGTAIKRPRPVQAIYVHYCVMHTSSHYSKQAANDQEKRSKRAMNWKRFGKWQWNTYLYTRVHGNATRACQRCRITVSWSNVLHVRVFDAEPRRRWLPEVVTGQGRQLSPTIANRL